MRRFLCDLCIVVVLTSIVVLLSFVVLRVGLRLRILRVVRCVAVGVCDVACYHPLSATRKGDGSIVVTKRGDGFANLTLACGRCVGCRLESARQWSVRVMHESMLHERNCFITLTYDDAHVPSHGSINYLDFKRFIRRLRKHFGNRVIRYFACGEYGEKFDRPHFHACIFGIDFHEDATAWRKSEGGFAVKRSATLEKLWPYGLSEVGELTRQSAAYVARYSLKKVTGARADEHYKSVDKMTGEVVWREPECVHMSLKPGIGAGWFERFASDVYPHDRVIVDGFKSRPPRYYDKLMRRRDKDVILKLKKGRVQRARERWFDNTDRRLAAKETVAVAGASLSKRKLV